MESHDAVSVQDRQNIVVQKLADLNSALTKAKTDRIRETNHVRAADIASGESGCTRFTSDRARQ